MALPVSPQDARARHIKRSDMVACALAFIDCRMPGSERKQNYALVGPGVSQSPDQVVNLTEAHGFSLGVAAMPPGTVNNLHIHFTAEVFMIQRGTWTFRWGEAAAGDPAGHCQIEAGPGDVVSIPTWIFRGFSNSGAEDGWIFTALGGDDTGGIIWHPSILDNAAAHGMFLTQDNMLVDTASGRPRPDPEDMMPPLTTRQIAALPRYTPEQMAGRVVKARHRAWSSAALLSSCLPGHAAELAPVLGHGITEDRAHEPPIGNPHGFSIEWLRIPAGNSTGRHGIDAKQVLIVFSGAVDIVLNEPGAETMVHVATGECFSLPAGAWRSIAAGRGASAESALVTAGDQRKRITWAPEIAMAALQSGRVLDHDGHVALSALLPPSTRNALAARLLQAAE